MRYSLTDYQILYELNQTCAAPRRHWEVQTKLVIKHRIRIKYIMIRFMD